MKMLEEWGESALNFSDYCKPGDAVDEDIIDYFIGLLPPRTLTMTFVQVGEPYSYKKDKNKHYRNTYSTFIKRKNQWYFCGNCFAGRDTEA